jgi:hypothetical protein
MDSQRRCDFLQEHQGSPRTMSDPSRHHSYASSIRGYSSTNAVSPFIAKVLEARAENWNRSRQGSGLVLAGRMDRHRGGSTDTSRSRAWPYAHTDVSVHNRASLYALGSLLGGSSSSTIPRAAVNNPSFVAIDAAHGSSRYQRSAGQRAKVWYRFR